jgi:BlaI family transcriptional regulator, penicillinase repressor
MDDEVPSLGDLEIRVMQLVWEQQPCTERQVSDRLQVERELARTTVLKTMQRLEAKGLLRRIAGETPVRFEATHEKRRLLPALVQRFVETVLGGEADPLVAYLADSGKLSSRDLSTLRSISRKLAVKRDQGGES